MQVLCKCYASSMHFNASAIQVLCKCYAIAMQVLCKCYANAMQVLCRCYGSAMQVLCRCNASDIQMLCKSYNNINAKQVLCTEGDMWKKFPFPYEDSFGVVMGTKIWGKYWRFWDCSQNLQPGLHIWVKAKNHEKFQNIFLQNLDFRPKERCFQYNF